MKIEFYLNWQLLIWVGLFLLWFCLPILVDLKKTMKDPIKREHAGWVLYGLFISLPMIGLLLILYLISRILHNIQIGLAWICARLMQAMGMNEKP